jgi:hypothetical protein
MSVVFVLLGVFTGTMFCTGKRSTGILIGMVSGIFTALVFTALVAFPEITADKADFTDWLVPLAEILLASVSLQVFGAWFHEPRRGSGQDDLEVSLQSAMTKQLRSYWFVFPVLLAVMIIPPVCIGMTTETVADELSYCAEPVSDRVEVTRTGPDSLRIVMKPDMRITHDPVPAVKILIDEKDVSNQSMIILSRFDVVIEPPEGLPFKRKASVSLRGIDISGNETEPVHLQVIVSYPDRGIRHVICDMQV